MFSFSSDRFIRLRLWLLWAYSGSTAVRWHHDSKMSWVNAHYRGMFAPDAGPSFFTPVAPLDILSPSRSPHPSLPDVCQLSVEFSSRMRRRCLRILSRHARRLGCFPTSLGNNVVFEVRYGYNTECAYVYFLLPFITVAEQGAVVVVQAPLWVYRTLCALPLSVSPFLAPVEVGLQVYTPSPATLVCALNLWDVNTDSPYYQFHAAFTAAERLG